MTAILNKLSKKHKSILVVLLDLFLLPVSVWLSFSIQFSQWWPQELQLHWWLFLLSPLLALPLFVRWGLYRSILSYVSTRALFSIMVSVSTHVVLLAMVAIASGIKDVPLTVFAIYGLISLSLIGGSRLFLRMLLQWSRRENIPLTNVIVYGAGEAGAQLVEALQAGLEYRPVAFIDDNPDLHGKEIRGVKIYLTNDLGPLIKNFCVKQVLLAIPSVSTSRRREIINFIGEYPIYIRSVPLLMDIVSGRSSVRELNEIDLEDILGRPPIPPDNNLLSKCIENKPVLVTGAGGSIGSELCRQIVKLQPSLLILFEISEFALYNIEKELREYCLASSNGARNIKIIPVLGSVTNKRRLKQVMGAFAVKTVYHAAAYKHVPMVEYNPIEGVINNIFGTLYTAQAAIDAKVDTFIMISTDKAVRPTNVMGATKRVAELVIQSLPQSCNLTHFSIVRFGNVLGSSGSVVPLFRQQIQSGGPITLTHPDMTRYFMTISEAVGLVIQAGSMGDCGDVFVLNMGTPIRIEDLARRMISMSGLTVRDENNPIGDILIKTTKLRPGEKLFEELLLGENISDTSHPYIMRAHETKLPWQQLQKKIDKLELACNTNDCEQVRCLLEDIVEGYVPQCGIEDVVWKVYGNKKCTVSTESDVQSKISKTTPISIGRSIKNNVVVNSSE